MRTSLTLPLASILLTSVACPQKKDEAKKTQQGDEEQAPTKSETKSKSKSEAGTPQRPDDEPELIQFDFDETVPADSPSHFRVAETNGQDKPAFWTVKPLDDAPSPPHVFGISKSDNEGQTYNLAIVEKPELRDLRDVDVQVMVKPDTGEEDQGGGVMFRVEDHENYYVARWNPLENNARFYIVENSHRSALGKVDAELTDDWHNLRVTAEGDRFELFIDERSVLTVQDGTFEKGTVGLWTKADAGTWFDDLTVIPLNAP